MFEFFVLSFVSVGVIEEVIIPVGSQAVDTATWAANQVAARVDQFMS